MRKIEFNELRIKNIHDEGTFYQYYLRSLLEQRNNEQVFGKPDKKYEIIYLNILGGKLVLLNKEYILKKDDEENAEIFYDYNIAYEVYNHWLDIYDGIESEQFEFNELYKKERLEKDLKIQELRNKDDKMFCNAINEYNIITNSVIYTDYLKLIEENKKLKEINIELLEQIKAKKEKKGLWQKIIHKSKNKKLLNSGENNDR